MQDLLLTIHLYSASFFNHTATKLGLVVVFFAAAYVIKTIFERE